PRSRQDSGAAGNRSAQGGLKRQRCVEAGLAGQSLPSTTVASSSRDESARVTTREMPSARATACARSALPIRSMTTEPLSAAAAVAPLALPKNTTSKPAVRSASVARRARPAVPLAFRTSTRASASGTRTAGGAAGGGSAMRTCGCASSAGSPENIPSANEVTNAHTSAPATRRIADSVRARIAAQPVPERDHLGTHVLLPVQRAGQLEADDVTHDIVEREGQPRPQRRARGGIAQPTRLQEVRRDEGEAESAE